MKNSWENWSTETIHQFQTIFLEWYFANHRKLPWRDAPSAYHIWISEIMLQQTRVETVIDYYLRFMEKYPTIESLAHSKEEELLKIWEGLGYYSRARNLRIAANQILETFDGSFPSTPHDISSLKGIGPYTTGAISSIAFHLPEPAIDGNILRVTSRLFEIAEDISYAKSRKTFDGCMRTIISHKYPGEFNQAMMDLGSGICTPKSPKCEECPIQAFCLSFTNRTQESFPVKTKKLKQKPVYYLAVAKQNTEGAYLLKKRSEKGLLASMWTFPLIEVSHSEYQKAKKNQFPQAVMDKIPEAQMLSQNLGEITHIFSHLKWHVLLFTTKTELKYVVEESNHHTAWVKVVEDSTLTFPKPQLKLFELLKTQTN